MKRLLVAVLVLGGLVLPDLARAQVKVAVFDLEAAAGAQDVATKVTTILRRKVSNQVGFSLAPGKSLAEIKLVFGCAETPLDAYHQCLAKVGQSLNSDRLIFGKARKQGGGYHVTLTYLDVKSPTSPKTVSEAFTAAQATGPGIESLVTQWHGTLFGIAVKGTLRISCNVPGATVNVDGRVVGECDAGGLRVPVEAGTRQVTVSKSGFATTTRMAVVKAASVTDLQVTLTATSRPPPDDVRRPPPDDGGTRLPPGGDGTTPPKGGDEKPRDPKLMWKALFYSTVSVGAALLVSSIFTGMKVKSLEQDKEAEIIRSWEDPNPDNWVTDKENACANNRGNQALVNICNKGTNMATATNALIGAGAVLAAGSMAFMYMAYFYKSGKEKPESSGQTTSVAVPEPTVVVTPEIMQRGAGFSATLRF